MGHMASHSRIYRPGGEGGTNSCPLTRGLLARGRADKLMLPGPQSRNLSCPLGLGGLVNQSGDGVDVWRAKGGAELELRGSARHECGARRVGLSGLPFPRRQDASPLPLPPLQGSGPLGSPFLRTSCCDFLAILLPFVFSSSFRCHF